MDSIVNTESHCDKPGQPLVSTKPLPASLSSALDTHTKHLEWKLPPKKVIAMVTNVAAFGLRGSSQT